MREEEIRKVLSGEIESRQKMAENLIREAYEEKRESYIKSFVNIVDIMLKKCIDLQNLDRDQYDEGCENVMCKGALTYIYISYMRSSMEAGAYDYLVRIYDDNDYNDIFEVEGRFICEYKLKYLREDEDYFREQIMKQIIRAKKYKVKDFMRGYITDTYLKPVPYEIQDSIDKIRELESYMEVRKDSNLAVYYGEFYDRYEKKFSFT